MTSGSVNVCGNVVWYEKFGTGGHPILLFPGAIGTGRSDFGPQIQGPNALNLKKYTLIAIEPIGWGRSRPPNRTYDCEVFNKDANCGYKIMESIGFSTYSVMGWSDGAKTALLMAILYPSRIKSCIVWGVVTFATAKDLKAITVTKNIKYWGQDLIDNYEKVYGNEWMDLWKRHMEFLENVTEIFPNGFFKHELKRAQCPVFILHGDQVWEEDPVVSIEHPQHVLKSIPDSRLHRFAKAAHNLHFTCAAEFKKEVEDFLEEVDCGY